MTKYLGLEGEKFAEKFLESKGYKILARNFAVPMGELDIVAVKNKTLTFVEVKARAYSAFGGPVAAVTAAKQKRLYKASVAYIKQHNPSYEDISFDVIAITGTEIEHIPGAFCPKRGTI